MYGILSGESKTRTDPQSTNPLRSLKSSRLDSQVGFLWLCWTLTFPGALVTLMLMDYDSYHWANYSAVSLSGGIWPWLTSLHPRRYHVRPWWCPAVTFVAWFFVLGCCCVQSTINADVGAIQVTWWDFWGWILAHRCPYQRQGCQSLNFLQPLHTHTALYICTFVHICTCKSMTPSLMCWHVILGFTVYSTIKNGCSTSLVKIKGLPLQLNVTLVSGIFGQKLEETVRYERRFGNKLAPMLVEQCVDFIRQWGLREEGLFRLPGQANLVKELQDAFDCGEKPSFDW